MTLAKGKPRRWTVEEVNEVMNFSGREEAEVLAKKFNVNRSTLYSLRTRVKDAGSVEAMVASQGVSGIRIPGGQGNPLTVEDHLAKVYNITSSNGGRGKSVQYTITLPPPIAEALIKKWGRQIRFVPTDEGVLVVPVKPPTLPEFPDWMKSE